MNDNYRFPQVTHEIRAYWLSGFTGGQKLVGPLGHFDPDKTPKEVVRFAELLVFRKHPLPLLSWEIEAVEKENICYS